VTNFLTWCERQGAQKIEAIRPVMVAAYIEQMQGSRAALPQSLSRRALAGTAVAGEARRTPGQGVSAGRGR